MRTEHKYKIPIPYEFDLVTEIHVWAINNLENFSIHIENPTPTEIFTLGRQIGKTMMIHGQASWADVSLKFYSDEDLNYFNLIFKDRIQHFQIETSWFNEYNQDY